MPFPNLPDTLSPVSEILAQGQWVILCNTLMPDGTIVEHEAPGGRQFILFEFYSSSSPDTAFAHESGGIVFERLTRQIGIKPMPGLAVLKLVDVIVNPVALPEQQEQANEIFRLLAHHWGQGLCLGIWDPRKQICLDDAMGRWIFVQTGHAVDSKGPNDRPLYTLKTYVAGKDLC